MQTSSAPVVLPRALVDALPAEPFDHLPGVRRRILWRDGESEAGVLDLDPGAHLGSHTHHANHHHFWVLSGCAVVLGDELTAGSYVHIPHGVEHDIDASHTDGCSVFYLYLRHVVGT